MGITASFHRLIIGSGLDRLKQDAPLLANRWSIIRGINPPSSDHQDLEIKTIRSHDSASDWQDDLATALMALILLAGISVSVLLDPVAWAMAINPFAYIAKFSLWVSGSYLATFVLIQLSVLVLCALAWRHLIGVPILMWASATWIFACWSLAMLWYFPNAWGFIFLPMMLVALLCLMVHEIKRATTASGASVWGCLAIMAVICISIAILWSHGFIHGMLELFSALHEIRRTEMSRRSGDFVFMLMLFIGLVISVIASLAWSNKLMLAWCANDKNSPVLCAGTAGWTLLMDAATLGVFPTLYSHTPHGDPNEDSSEKPTGTSQVSDRQRQPAPAPQRPIRIGENLEKSIPGKGQGTPKP